MKAVATHRLQDARKVMPSFHLPVIPLYSRFVEGELIWAYVDSVDGERYWECIMAQFYEVDGVSYPQYMAGNSRHLMSYRNDDCIDPFPNGECGCSVPGGYKPVRYDQGEICMTCWMTPGPVAGIYNIRAVGRDGCYHN